MEIQKKEMKQASYNVVAQQGDLIITANVTIGAEGAVINIDGGSIQREGKFMASFGKYGENMNVNYSALSLEEMNAVNEVIEDFIKAVQK
jgi:hypothetical protein